MSQTTEPTTEEPEEVQVLEFTLGTETYALDITYIEEIAHVGELTPIPNAPEHISGVMDLRGRTTSVIDPKQLFDVGDGGEGDRILVFDPEQLPEQGPIGWTVDDVHQVVDARPDDLDRAPGMKMDAIRGILRREDGFVIWVDPEAVAA